MRGAYSVMAEPAHEAPLTLARVLPAATGARSSAGRIFMSLNSGIAMARCSNASDRSLPSSLQQELGQPQVRQRKFGTEADLSRHLQRLRVVTAGRRPVVNQYRGISQMFAPWLGAGRPLISRA